MRVMVKFAVPVEVGNDALRSGKLAKVFQQLHEDLKPEAAYFYPEGGERAGFFIVDMEDSWRVADTVERFFFGLEASIELTPVMTGEDLEKALSGVAKTIERYG